MSWREQRHADAESELKLAIASALSRTQTRERFDDEGITRRGSAGRALDREAARRR